jgi:hypothetical protein
MIGWHGVSSKPAPPPLARGGRRCTRSHYPDPFHELAFPSALDAKRAIADHLGLPLAKLAPEQLAALNVLLETTLAKQTVWQYVRHHLDPLYRG